jgi:hypothetical protein
VRSIEFSQEGDLLTASDDGTVKIYRRDRVEPPLKDAREDSNPQATDSGARASRREWSAAPRPP